MNIKDARKYVEEFWDISSPSEEEEFFYVECMQFLIDAEKKPEDMLYLGGYYYEQKNFELALKYYELAAEYGEVQAYAGLGYIWYYGRTGEKNYEKAFYYYTKASEAGDLQCKYKLADMYKNGYFVEKNQEQYESIIEELYPQVKKCRRLNDPVPEVYTRLARIRKEQGKEKEALKLYYDAKDFLAQRLCYSTFFGDFNIMKWMVADIYELTEFKDYDFDLFDLYYVLLKPTVVTFEYDETTYTVESLMDGDECVIKFGDKWYRTVDDFLSKAEIDGEKISTLNMELYNFDIVGIKED